MINSDDQKLENGLHETESNASGDSNHIVNEKTVLKEDHDESSAKPKALNYFYDLGLLLLQFGHFILNNREYVALVFLSVTLLPLFNFASMGMLAYIAYPLLVLSAMQVLYYAESSSVLRDGIKLNTSYIDNVLDLSKISYSGVEESDSSKEDEEAILLNSDDNDADSYWKAFLSFNLTKLFSNLHPSVVSEKWQDAEADDKTFISFIISAAKISAVYTGVYYGASLVTPYIISPLHSLLAVGGSYGLVGSYFVVLGLGYLATLLTNTKIDPTKNQAWYQASGITAVAAVLAFAITYIVMAPASWLPTVLATPGMLVFIAPLAIAFAALGANTTNAIKSGSTLVPVGGGNSNPVSSEKDLLLTGDGQVDLTSKVKGNSEEMIDFSERGDSLQV